MGGNNLSCIKADCQTIYPVAQCLPVFLFFCKGSPLNSTKKGCPFFPYNSIGHLSLSSYTYWSSVIKVLFVVTGPLQRCSANGRQGVGPRVSGFLASL